MITPIDLASELRQIPLLAELPEREIAQLAAECRTDQFHTGDTIFYQGDEASRFWIVREGQVKIVRHDETGRETILEIVPPGETFGSAALFLPRQPATAQAMTEVTTINFPFESYKGLVNQNPGLALKVIHMLAARLYMFMQMNVLAGERVERRLAHILLKLAARSGKPHPEGVVISIHLSRQDLADMSGTTLETAIRLMSRFRSEGLIKTRRGGYIVILDIDRLREMART